MTARKGALPEEWDKFISLGLLPDLLPVVTDMSLPSSPLTKIKPSQRGKIPTRLNSKGEVTGFKEWSEHIATERQVKMWRGRDIFGISVVCRSVKVIDVDISDPVKAARAWSIIEAILGPVPKRFRSNSSKFAVPIRLSDVMPKEKLWLPDSGDDAIEFLATGQQFVAAGMHPSGARIEWENLDEIPVVSRDEFDMVWDALQQAFNARRGRSRLAVEGIGMRRAEDADDPVIDFLEDTGQVRKYRPDGVLDVVCPWETEHSNRADADDTSTTYFPAGVGRAQAGFKCMHGHCDHRTLSEYLDGCGYTAVEVQNEFDIIGVPPATVKPLALDEVMWQPFESEQDRPPMLRSGKPLRIEPNATYVCGILERPDLCGARLGYDTFLARIMIEWHDAQGSWRPLRDTDYVRLRLALESLDFKRPGTEIVRECVAYVAEVHQFDSARRWVKNLVWDGVPRVEKFFSECFGVDDSPFSRAVGRYTWTALAGRASVPGCKVDMVPTLIGAQGLRKTSGVEAICPTPTAFVELSLDVHDDDLARKMRGKLVGELGELRGLAGKDGEAIKQWLSRKEEEWPPKYQEFTTTFPRRLVFFGTGNNHEFLEDDENRRWLPMWVTRQVDVDRIVRERDQLWAEGLVLFEAAGQQAEWEQAEKLAVVEHRAFMVGDPWQPIIEAWLAHSVLDDEDGPLRGDSVVRTHDLLISALKKPEGQIAKKDEMRVGKILRRMGYVNGVHWVGSKAVRGYKNMGQEPYC